ncbi:MAG: amidohydrolase family protein [Ilumatobacteraceae bacterium]
MVDRDHRQPRRPLGHRAHRQPRSLRPRPPGRFATFCHLDWSLLAHDDAADLLVANLLESIERGARGVKVWKDLGLKVRDGRGQLVWPDDERVLPALRLAGQAGIPVVVHTADPIAFFEPIDVTNERLEELSAHPDWWFGGPGLPTFDDLLASLDRLVAACPDTTFIGAHVGNAAEDLGLVARMLDEHPNYLVDLSARMAELGRQPRAARALVERHPDRVLFGTDLAPTDGRSYELWCRFLLTDDEAFDYAPGSPIPPQGRWQVSALDLPPELIEPVLAGNARRVLSGAGRGR